MMMSRDIPTTRRSTASRRGARASITRLTSIAAIALGLVVGCTPSTDSPAQSGNSTHPTSSANAHRAPSPFPADGFDQPTAPQVVNVFGEVNGAATGRGPLSGEAAFQQHTFTDEGYDSDVAVDPTGKWLAFSSTRNSEHQSIYLQRVDGTAVTQLTDGNSDDAYPCFSSDGKQIAFSSTRAGNWQVFVMDVDGHNITQVTAGPMQAVHPSFSPDASRLVYCGLGARSGQWELWTADLKTGEKRMIGYGLFPVWSPDKSADRIAFQRARQRGSRWFSLWTMDIIDGEGRRATEVAVSANAAILSPAWSPDGKRLAFTTIVQPDGGGSSKVKGQTDIWAIDADGANRQRLTDGRGENLMPFWASDNRVYFISDRGGTECVWSVRAESDQPALAKTSSRKDAPAVSTTDVRSAVP